MPPKEKVVKVEDTATTQAPVEEVTTAPPVTNEEGPEITAPTKRKRGRPSNAEKAAQVASDAGAAPVNDTSRPRKREKKGPAQFDQAARLQLANQVKGLHALAALGTGIPELNLADNEAVLLADAMANVAQEYGLSLSGKTGALIQLAAACALVYAPRFSVLNARVKANKAKPVEGPAMTVQRETPTDGAAATAH